MYDTIIKNAVANAKDSAVFVEGDKYEPYFKDMPDLKVIVCGTCGKRKETVPCIYGRDGTRRFPFGRPVKVLDARMKRNFPTVFTSNITADSLKHPPKATYTRITDRIIQSCYIIEDNSHNYRRENE